MNKAEAGTWEMGIEDDGKTYDIYYLTDKEAKELFARLEADYALPGLEHDED